MSQNVVQRIFFSILLFVVTVAFLWLILGFLQPIFWAVAFCIIMYPFHARLLALLEGRASLAAAISTALVVLIVVLPLALVAMAVTVEAAGLYERVSQGQTGLTDIYRLVNENLPQVISFLQTLGVDPERLQAQLSSAAVSVSQFLATRTLSIGQNTLRVAVFFFLMLYLLFFFLRDGRSILDRLVQTLPLGDKRERHLLQRFAEVSRATLKGSLVVGVVQGGIGGLTFALLGISAPVLWGALMSLLSILPALGPAIVWLPASIILISQGHWVQGAILIAVGTLIIGLVDNLLRPVLVGRDTGMPDYLILLSTLGGLVGFGLAGIVIGPIIAAFFLSTWEMAEEEFGQRWSARPTPAGEPAGQGDDWRTAGDETHVLLLEDVDKPRNS